MATTTRPVPGPVVRTRSPAMLTRQNTADIVQMIHSAPIGNILYFMATLLQDLQLHTAPPFANAPAYFKEAIAAAREAVVKFLQVYTTSAPAGRFQKRQPLPPKRRPVKMATSAPAASGAVIPDPLPTSTPSDIVVIHPPDS